MVFESVEQFCKQFHGHTKLVEKLLRDASKAVRARIQRCCEASSKYSDHLGVMAPAEHARYKRSKAVHEARVKAAASLPVCRTGSINLGVGSERRRVERS